MRKYFCIFCVLILCLSLTACKKEAPKEEQLKNSITERLQSDMIPHLSAGDEDLQLAYDYYVSQMSDESKSRLDLLEAHYQHLKIEVLSVSKDEAELKIIAPNLAELTKSYAQNEEFEDITEMKKAITADILSEKYQTLESVVTVPYFLDENGKMVFEETSEYLDAVYGGLVSLYFEQVQQLSEVANNE